MSDFDTLCKQLEQMDSAKYAEIFSDISADVIAELIALTADGKDAKLDLTVETASDADADKLRTLAKSGLMPLTAMVKDAKDEGMKLASGVLQATKIAGEGKVASLSVAYAADNLIKFVSERKKNVLK